MKKHGQKKMRIGWQMHERAAVVLVAAFLCGGASLAREQVTIQKGATGNQQLRAADTWLNQANQTGVNNPPASLQVESNRNNVRRTLVLFDLSIVPNAGIKTATLTLNATNVTRNGRTYSANLITSFWEAASASWADRVGTGGNATAWGAAGGDFDATVGSASNTAAINGTGKINWTVTTAVQSWYNGTANYGFLIQDTNEGRGATATTTFGAMEDPTVANRPELTLTFVQNVTNLTAIPGSGQIAVSWQFPAAIGTILEAYKGVLILRRQGAPVDKGSVPADLGGQPGLCTTVGTGTVVFVSNATSTTSFVDDSADKCGSPVNGNMYYYKVFAYDAAGYYSSNPSNLPSPRDGASTFTAEAGAMPNLSGTTQRPLWMFGTHSNTLAPPGIEPASQVDIGTDTNQIFAVNSTTGQYLYPPVALGGLIAGRMPILDAGSASIGRQVAYVASEDNYVYAIDTVTGEILWLTEPGGSTTNLFEGGAAVQLKEFSAPGLPNDLVFVATRNGASTATNRIYALDGNLGAVTWTHTGSAGTTTALDIVSSTPMVDYAHNSIWVTSHANGGANQPNLWRLDSLTGAVVYNGNFGGGDIDSSATLSANNDVLFVGTNGNTAPQVDGRLYAINPLASTLPAVSPAVQGSSVAFYDDGSDGPVHGFPFVANFNSPYTVVYTTNTQVHAVSFNVSTNTFTKLWTTAVFSAPNLASCAARSCTLSAPVVSFTQSMVYTGGSDGMLYELNLATGALSKSVVVDIFYPAVVGDPALDEINQQIFVSTVTNDQRVYSFVIPF